MKELQNKGRPFSPCPFCGSKNILMFESTIGYYSAECYGCGASIRRNTYLGAKRAWNRRKGGAEK